MPSFASLMVYLLVCLCLCLVASITSTTNLVTTAHAQEFLSSVANVWAQDEVQRVVPEPRIGAVAVRVGSQNSVIVLGGFRFNPFGGTFYERVVPLGDVWEYRIVSDSWEVSHLDESIVLPRPIAFHKTIGFSDILGRGYYFGGFTLEDSSQLPSETNRNVPVDELVSYRAVDGVFTSEVVQRTASDAPWPPARTLHIFELLAPQLAPLNFCGIVFGGFIGNNTYLGDTWVVDLQTHEWTQIQGPSPTARAGHVAYRVRSELVMTGGCNETDFRRCLNSTRALRDVWKFTLTSDSCSEGRWEFLEQTAISGIPIVWGGQPTAVIDDELFLFHDSGDTSNANHIMLFQPTIVQESNFSYSVTGGRWTFTSSSQVSQRFPQRFGAACLMMRSSLQTQVFVFGGGQEAAFYNDMWVFLPSALLWSETAASDLRPLSLAHAATVHVGNRLYLTGGQDARGQVNSHMWVYDIDRRLWTVTRATGVAVTGASLSAISPTFLLAIGGFRGRAGGSALTQTTTFLLLGDASGVTQSAAHDASSRAFHSAVYDEETMRVYVYGGWRFLNGVNFRNAIYRNDLFVGQIIPPANPSTVTPEIEWTVVPQGFESPGPLAGHLGVKVELSGKQYMVIFGGCTPSGLSSDHAYLMKIGVPTSELSWRVIDVQAATTKPSAFVASSLVLEQAIITFGGLFEDVHETWTASDKLHAGQIDLEKGIFHWSAVITLSRSVGPRTSASYIIKNADPPTLTILGGFGMKHSVIERVGGQHSLILGCNPGSFSPKFATQLCQRCPVGSYAPGPGNKRCLQCPGISTTPGTGSVRETDCSLCEPGTCVNGDCLVEIQTGSFRCLCETGFGGSRCDVNIVGVVFGTFLGIFFCAAVGYFIFRSVKTRFLRMRKFQDLQEQLIQESQQELTELKKAWEIRPEDLQFVRAIDAGAFGEVWQASWQDREVAVKKLKQSVNLFDVHAVEDFDAEVSLIRSLRHRNIVFFYGAGVEDGCPFLVTEYMSRGSLSSILQSGIHLSKQRCIQFALDTASGMTFLHELDPPRIHRDLKSANLLVSTAWVVKVADFGTARLCNHVLPGVPSNKGSQAGSNYSSTSMTTAVGTLVWSAPEVLSGKPYGAYADVYSFGIVLYEIATREIPYDDVDMPTWELRAAIVDGLRPQKGLPPRDSKDIESGSIRKKKRKEKAKAKARVPAEQSLIELEVERSTSTTVDSDDGESSGSESGSSSSGSSSNSNSSDSSDDNNDDGDHGDGRSKGSLSRKTKRRAGSRSGGKGATTYYPLALDTEFVSLMQQCVIESPALRPSMRETRDKLDELYGQNR